MTIDDTETTSGAASPTPGLAARLQMWVDQVASADGLMFGITVVSIFSSLIVVGMNSALYSATIHDGLAFGGAAVGYLLTVVSAYTLGTVWRLWPRPRWIAAAIPAGLVILAFALTPPINAGRGWLSVVFAALVALVTQAIPAGVLLLYKRAHTLKAGPFAPTS